MTQQRRITSTELDRIIVNAFGVEQDLDVYTHIKYVATDLLPHLLQPLELQNLTIVRIEGASIAPSFPDLCATPITSGLPHQPKGISAKSSLGSRRKRPRHVRSPGSLSVSCTSPKTSTSTSNHSDKDNVNEHDPAHDDNEEKERACFASSEEKVSARPRRGFDEADGEQIVPTSVIATDSSDNENKEDEAKVYPSLHVITSVKKRGQGSESAEVKRISL